MSQHPAGTVWARFTRPERAPTGFFGPLRDAFCPKIDDPAKLTREGSEGRRALPFTQNEQVRRFIEQRLEDGGPV
jgi:hypothetical protein